MNCPLQSTNIVKKGQEYSEKKCKILIFRCETFTNKTKNEFSL